MRKIIYENCGYIYSEMCYDDIFYIKELRNSQNDILRTKEIHSDENQIRWWNDIVLPSQNCKMPSTKLFSILYDNILIGYGGVCYIDWKNKTGELSFLVEKSENKYEIHFTNFLYFIKFYFFEIMKLNRLWSETYNIRNLHISILEKNGFIKEGQCRQTRFINNKYVDSIYHSIICDEYIINNNNNNKKYILVTGGAGLIGMTLIEKLVNNGNNVICVDIKKKPSNKIFDNVTYYSMDANNITKMMLNKYNIETIYHLASTFERLEESIDFLEINYHNNVKLSHHMISLAKDLNIKKFIFTSSYLIYDSVLYTFDEPQSKPYIISENTFINPRNLCGVSKLMCEKELEFIQNFYNIQCIETRIFRVFGNDTCGLGGGTIINRWIDQLISGNNELIVYADGGMFDYIYSEDIAECLLRLKETEYKGIVNIGSGTSHTIRDVLNILKKYFPKMVEKHIDVNIKYEACQANIDKLVEIIGWKPNTSLEEGIRKKIENAINN